MSNLPPGVTPRMIDGLTTPSCEVCGEDLVESYPCVECGFDPEAHEDPDEAYERWREDRER